MHGMANRSTIVCLSVMLEKIYYSLEAQPNFLSALSPDLNGWVLTALLH